MNVSGNSANLLLAVVFLSCLSTDASETINEVAVCRERLSLKKLSAKTDTQKNCKPIRILFCLYKKIVSTCRNCYFTSIIFW